VVLTRDQNTYKKLKTSTSSNHAPTREKEGSTKSPFDFDSSDGEERRKVPIPVRKPIFAEKRTGMVSRMRGGTKQSTAVQEAEDAVPLKTEKSTKSIAKSVRPERIPELTRQEQMDMDIQLSINKMLNAKVAPASQIKELTSLIGTMQEDSYEPPETAKLAFEQARLAQIGHSRQYAAKTYGKGRRVLGYESGLSALAAAAQDDEPSMDADLGVDAEVRVTSLHELKEAGEMRKFHDNIDYTMEGLKTVDRSIRRTTALVLAKDLLQGDFLDKMCTNKFPILVSNCLLQHQDDALLQLLWTLILFLFSKDLRAAQDLLKQDGERIVQRLCDGLRADDLLDTAVSASLSSAEWKRAKQITEFVQEHNLPLSTRSLTIQTLSALIASGRSKSGLETIGMETLMTRREALLEVLQDADGGEFVAGISLLPSLCVQDAPPALVEWTLKHATKHLTEDWQVTMPMLKLIINLSAHEGVSKKMGETSILPRTLELLLKNYQNDTFPPDVSILVIASLVNLVGKVPENRALFVKVKVEGKPVLPLITHAYKQVLTKANDEMVLSGYWSLLLGCLLRDGLQSEHIVAKLPGGIQDGVGLLIERLREFSEFQRAYMDEVKAKRVSQDFDELIAQLMLQ
jgi:hypothetical protein